MTGRRARAWLLPAALLSGWMLLARATHADARTSSHTLRAPSPEGALAISPELLSAWSRMLQDDRPAQRRAAIDQLLALGTEALPALGMHLRELSRIGMDGRSIAPKLAHLRRLQRSNHTGNRPSADSLAAALSSDRSVAMRHAVELLAIHQALLAQQTPDAAEVLVGDLFRLAPSAMRSDALRARRQLGRLLGPAYLRQATMPNPTMRRLSRAALAALGMSTPRQAFQHPDPNILLSLLQVYGELRTPDALPWLIAYVGDPRPTVDAAARTASARFGEQAMPLLRERYLRLAHHPAPDDWDAGRTLAELESPTSSTSERAAATVEVAEAALLAGKLPDAERSLDLGLRQVRGAALNQRIATAYLALGAWHRAASDLPAALTAFRRALRRAPTPALEATARARILQLEAELRLPEGVADLHSLATAAALDPTLTRAGELIYELSGARAAEDLAHRRRAGLTAASLLALAAALLLRDARRRARARSQHTRYG